MLKREKVSNITYGGYWKRITSIIQLARYLGESDLLEIK
jgi:hypothetical protein